MEKHVGCGLVLTERATIPAKLNNVSKVDSSLMSAVEMIQFLMDDGWLDVSFDTSTRIRFDLAQLLTVYHRLLIRFFSSTHLRAIWHICNGRLVWTPQVRFKSL